VYGVQGEIESVSLARLSDDLRRLDPATEFLVARDCRRGDVSSVAEIEVAVAAAGLRLEPVRRERLMSVFRVQR
jgi:hypothetical protein